jgi:hypothetical protein
MRRALLLGLAVVGAVVLAAGAALAYLASTGGGAGAATVAQAQPLTVSAGSAPSAYLFPTGTPSGDVTVTIANPNPAAVHVSRLDLDTARGTGGFSLAGCDLAFTSQTNAGAGWTVPAASGGTPGSLSLDLTGSLTMATSAPNACQSAAHTSFTVYLKAS